MLSEANPDPKQLADICLNGRYKGPFDLLFYCYYAFPTAYPEDIPKIFGKKYFKENIEPESGDEFYTTIREKPVAAVVTFNKEIFNLVAKEPVDRCEGRLIQGEVIQSQIKGMDQSIPVFLTFPTGWRFHKQFRLFRKNNLEAIMMAICGT